MGRSRGFVAIELLVVVTALELASLVEFFLPSIDRVCVGAGSSARGERPRAIVPVERFVCEHVAGGEPPAYPYAASPRR